jgi:uncharacterized protein
MSRLSTMKSKVYLLDSNVLIALATPEHSLNTRAAKWFQAGRMFATCPMTQGALFRFHMRVGVGATAESARQLLQTIGSLPRHEFWPDDLPYLEVETKGIVGHRQVTDAYLVALARAHGGALATLDEGLAAVHPGVEFVG